MPPVLPKIDGFHEKLTRVAVNTQRQVIQFRCSLLREMQFHWRYCNRLGEP